MIYKAFISYSHAADGKLAPAVESGLRRLNKPFLRPWSLRTFRDQTTLQLTPHLWPSIQAALQESEYFILLASPEAARSVWVIAEVTEWLQRLDNPRDRLLLVLTEGRIVWDRERNDFDPERTTALPAELYGCFSAEPMFIDLRWTRTETDLSLDNPRFKDGVGTLASALHGVAKDVLIGQDIERNRRFRLGVKFVIVTLVVLAISLGSSSFLAWRNAERAATNAREALDQRNMAVARQLAMQADLLGTRSPASLEKSLLVGIESLRSAPLLEGDRVVRWAVGLSRKLLRRVDSENNGLLSPDSRLYAAQEGDSISVSDLATGREVKVAAGGGEALAFSPDDRYLITEGEFPETGHLWDLASGREVGSCKDPEENIVAAEFSQNGETLATVTAWSDLRLWRFRGGTCTPLRRTSLPLAPFGLSHDGKLLGTSGPAALIETATGRILIGEIPPPAAEAISTPNNFTLSHHFVEFSPDDSLLLIAGESGTRVIDIKTRRTLFTLSDLGEVTVAHFNRKGSEILIGASDGLLTLLDARTGRRVWKSIQCGSSIQDVTTDSADRYVVSAGSDSTARTWEVAGGREVARIPHSGSVLQVRLDPTSRFLTTLAARNFVGVDKQANVWSFDPPSVSGMPSAVDIASSTGMALSVNGKYLASRFNESVFVQDLEAPEMKWRFKREVDVLGLSLTDAFLASADGIVEVRRLADHQILHAEIAEGSYIAVSPEGRYLAAWRPKSGITVVDQAPSPPLTILRFVKELETPAVALSPAASHLIAVSGAETVTIYDLTTGRSSYSFRRRKPYELMTHLAFDKSGKRLAGSEGNTVWVWDRQRNQLLGEWRNVNRVSGVALSPDGEHVAGADGNSVRIWDIATGRETAQISYAHQIAIVQFTPDGRLLLAVEDGFPHPRFYRDYWRPADLIVLGCSLVTRPLTPAESKDLGIPPHETCPAQFAVRPAPWRRIHASSTPNPHRWPQPPKPKRSG